MLFRCNKIVDMNSSVDAMKDSWITFLMFVFSLLAEPKNYQKCSFPTKSTLGTPVHLLFLSPKSIMSTWMAPYA